MNNIKCLSLWQPWASLIHTNMKTIETRSWATDYRGPIAIHAATKWNGELIRLCLTEPFATCLKERGFRRDEFPSWKGPRYRARTFGLPFGAVVAVAELFDCRTTSNVGAIYPAWINGLNHKELAFGNYVDGRFGWFLRDIKILETPYTLRGRQGLWSLTREETEEVLSRVA